MNINEIIKTRRAIYPSQYEKGEIKKSFLKTLLKNANSAPTHRMTQPWFFKVYKGKSKDVLCQIIYKIDKEKYSAVKINKFVEKVKSSDTVISVCMTRDENDRVPEWEEVAAVSMAVQNMWLTCTAYNIGCYWSTPKYSIKMNDFFKLKNDERCLGFFYLGIYDHGKVKSKKRIPIEKKTEWNN